MKDELAMLKVSVRWVLCQLSDKHMHLWMAATIVFLTVYGQEGEAFVSRIVTGDETWVPINE